MESNQRNIEIVRLVESGQTLAEVGERYSITGERVRQILLRHGSRPTYSRIRPDEVDQIVGMFRFGQSPHQIALEIKRPIASVREILNTNGLWTPHPNALTCQVAAFHLGQAKLCFTDIARLVGISVQQLEYVRKRLRDSGLVVDLPRSSYFVNPRVPPVEFRCVMCGTVVDTRPASLIPPSGACFRCSRKRGLRTMWAARRKNAEPAKSACNSRQTC